MILIVRLGNFSCALAACVANASSKAEGSGTAEGATRRKLGCTEFQENTKLPEESNFEMVPAAPLPT